MVPDRFGRRTRWRHGDAGRSGAQSGLADGRADAVCPRQPRRDGGAGAPGAGRAGAGRTVPDHAGGHGRPVCRDSRRGDDDRAIVRPVPPVDDDRRAGAGAQPLYRRGRGTARRGAVELSRARADLGLRPQFLHHRLSWPHRPRRTGHLARSGANRRGGDDRHCRAQRRLFAAVAVARGGVSIADAVDHRHLSDRDGRRGAIGRMGGRQYRRTGATGLCLCHHGGDHRAGALGAVAALAQCRAGQAFLSAPL